MNKLSSDDRSALLRLAGLQKTSSRKWVEDRDSGYWSYQENGKEIGGVDDNGTFHAYIGAVNEDGEPIDSSRSLRLMKVLVEGSV